MTEIITRHILHKNLTLTVHRGLYEIDFYKGSDLIPLINRAKTYLIKEKQCKPGQSIFLTDVTWPSYLAWFFAGAELGLNFIVSEVPLLSNNFDIIGKRLLEKYGTIDFFIGDIRTGKALLGDTFSDIDKNLLNDYHDESLGNVVHATPDSILIKSVTSGTTGEPKLVTHTHKLFYLLMDRNAKIYNLQTQNRCLHTKILHHGSVIGVFFLPTLKYCARHYWINPSKLPAKVGFYANMETTDLDLDHRNILFSQILTKVINDQLIDRVLLFYDMINILFFNVDRDYNKTNKTKATLYVLSPVKKIILDKLIKEYNFELVSIFGCTESSGPLFLQVLNNENYDSIIENNFGKPLDDFYDLNILDNQELEITMPDNNKIIPGDRFEKIGDDFYFLGRRNNFKIEGQTILTTLLVDFFESKFNMKIGHDFNLVFDQPNQKIYLRYETPIDLIQLNKELSTILGQAYKIHYQSTDPIKNFMSGIKFDADLFRKICYENLKKEI